MVYKIVPKSFQSIGFVPKREKWPLTININQPEAMLLQGITNLNEFKFLNLNKKEKNYWIICSIKIIIHI